MGNGDCRLRSPFEFLPFRGSDYGGDGRRRAGGRRRGSSQAEASGATTRITDDGANEQAKQIGDRSKARVLY